jgi:hypothetical protein
MDDQAFNIRIRIENNEVELSGSKTDVLKALDDLPGIVKKIVGAFDHISSISKNDEANYTMIKDENYPSISITSGTSCPEAIIKLLSTKWGRNKPRKLKELLEVMRVNAIYYPVGTVKGRLTDLTKKGVLRRIKSNGSYGYILIK